jgi:hypothetical protein
LGSLAKARIPAQVSRTCSRSRSVVAVALVAGGLFACGGGGHTLSGNIHVVEQLGLGSENKVGQACTGTGGYTDLHAGTSVVVKNEDGKVLATGTLDAGKIVALETCGFKFNVANVPDANFYQVEVSHRGEVTYSKKDLDDRRWNIDLSLG